MGPYFISHLGNDQKLEKAEAAMYSTKAFIYPFLAQCLGGLFLALFREPAGVQIRPWSGCPEFDPTSHDRNSPPNGLF